MGHFFNKQEQQSNPFEFFKPVEVTTYRAPRKNEDVCSVAVDKGVVRFSAAFGNNITDYKYLVFMENSITQEYAFVFTKKEMPNSFPLHFKGGDCNYFSVSSKGLTKELAHKIGVSNNGKIKMGPNISKNPDAVFRMIEPVE